MGPRFGSPAGWLQVGHFIKPLCPPISLIVWSTDQAFALVAFPSCCFGLFGHLLSCSCHARHHPEVLQGVPLPLCLFWSSVYRAMLQFVPWPPLLPTQQPFTGSRPQSLLHFAMFGAPDFWIGVHSVHWQIQISWLVLIFVSYSTV